MPIVFLCPESSLQCIYENKYAGKTFKCMHCDNVHRIPGLDLEKTKDGHFTFYCKVTKIEFQIKNSYYGEKFHCPKCKKYHLAKPKGETSDLSNTVPDIKPMEITEEAPVKKLKNDRHLRKKGSLKSKSSQSRIKKRTSINSKLSTGSSTILMSLQDENEILSQIINEQNYLNSKQSKKPIKLILFLVIILIALLFGIIFILDKQNHDGIQRSLQQAQSNILKMEFQKAVNRAEEAKRYQTSKVIFFKDSQIVDIDTRIDHYKRMQTAWAKYEKEVKPLLQNSTKIYALHRYHQKIDKELSSYKEEEPIYKYLLDKKLKLLAKEKLLIEKSFQEQLAKSKKLYNDGKLQSAIDYNSLTYKSWKLLDHNEIQPLNSTILASKIFYDHRKKIIADIAAVEDLTDTMGTLKDSIDSLNDAKRLADAIILRLDKTDTPLRNKIDKIKKIILSKLSNIKLKISLSPETKKLNEKVLKVFPHAVDQLKTALEELDGTVLTKVYAKKADFSSKNFSFALYTLNSGSGYVLAKDDFVLMYDNAIINVLPQIAILHFRTIKNLKTEDSMKKLKSNNIQALRYTSNELALPQGPFALASKKNSYLFYDNKVFIKKPRKSPLQNNSTKTDKLLSLVQTLSRNMLKMKKGNSLWQSFAKLSLNTQFNKSASFGGLIARHIFFGEYFRKIFANSPNKIKEAIKDIKAYHQKLDHEYIEDEFYSADDNSTYRLAIRYFETAKLSYFNSDKNETKIFSKLLITQAYNKHSFEIEPTFVSLFKEKVKNFRPKSQPTHYVTSHPVLGEMASYNIKTKTFTSDLIQWNKAMKAGYTNKHKSNKAINTNLKPYCLSIDSEGIVNSLFTKGGELMAPKNIDLKTDRVKWMNSAAKALQHPRELFLLIKFYFLNDNDPKLKKLSYFSKVLSASRIKDQSLEQFMKNQLIGRFLGNDLDLAKLLTEITRKQNRLSHIVSTPKGPVCCWVKIVNQNEFVLNILSTERPLQYKGQTLKEVYEKAFKPLSSGIIPFNPNEINIIMSFKEIPGDHYFRVDSKILIDKKLYSNIFKEKRSSLKQK